MEHLININFAPGGLPATVHVSQYDNTIRQLRFQLWFGRSKVEVPSGASVRVDIKKPDGHIVLVNGTVNSSDRSIVTVPTTKQMTAVPGGSRGTLVVSSTGDKRISSAIFILQVHRNPVEDGDASDSDLSMLQDAIDQTAANASAAKAAATAAQQAAESFTVDSTLDSTSTNAIQNKAVAAGFAAINESLETLANVTPIPDNSDLNDYTETGLYSIENSNYTILNYPDSDGIKSAATLEVKALTTGYIQQVMTKSAGRMFARIRYGNGNWQNWNQLTYLEPGLSTDEKNAIITCFENVAWSSQNANTVLNELKVLWGMGEDNDIEFKYPNDVSMIAGRMQKTSNDDNTAFLNTASNVHAATLGLANISDNSAPIKFNNAIYGIKQGSHNKINCEATYTGASNDLKWAFSVCTIIDGVYHIKTNGSKVDLGVSQSLPSNPNNDNYVFVKLEGNTLFPDQVTTSCTIKLIEE